MAAPRGVEGRCRHWRVLEIDTFTGYSALSMAAACHRTDASSPATRPRDERRGAPPRAGEPVRSRIDFRLGPALDTIATLDGPFDLVDNVLWSGQELDPADETADILAIRTSK